MENIPWDVILNPIAWGVGLIWLASACAAIVTAGFILLITVLLLLYPFACLYEEYKRK